MVNFSITLTPTAIEKLEMILGQNPVVETIDHDATAEISVHPDVLKDIFYYQTDSLDFVNAQTPAISDMRFACNPDNWTFNSFSETIMDVTNTSELNTTTFQREANQLTLKYDVANLCINVFFGHGGGGVGRISNAGTLLNDITNKNIDLLTKIRTLITDFGGSPNDPRLDIEAATILK